MQQYEVESYITRNGKSPFTKWLNGLKDGVAKAKINARIRRMSFGDFGDVKPIKGAQGLFEIREHYGSGYRIFYSLIDQKIILILAGSTKQDQNKAIIKAREYLDDYQRRENDDKSQ